MSDTEVKPGFRTAIVGAGLISDLHIQGIRQLGNATIAAIADCDGARAQRKADQYNIPQTFDDPAEMMRRVEADVVHVLTPPSTHAALCIDALESGAHVYVEKPMAGSDADCVAMAQAAQRTGRQLCVGHSLVYDPLLRRALDAIERGEIGDVLHASAVYCFNPRRIPGYNSKIWYRRLPGGFVEDLTTHPASVLLRLLGPLQSVQKINDRAAADHDAVSALLACERGTGTLFVSLSARPEDVSVEVRGTRGIASVNFSTMVVSVQRDRGLPRKLVHGFRNMSAARDLAVQTVTNTARFLTKRIDTTKGVHTLITSFYRALEAERPAPVDSDEGRDVVRVLRALWPDTGSDAPAPRVVSAVSATQRNTVTATEAPAAVRSALVTGATGFIGRHLVRALVARGVQVRALARDERRARALVAPGVEAVIGDLADSQTIAGLADGVDTIFHLASVMTGSGEEFEQVDLQGTRQLIGEARRAGIKRFIFTSTLGAYAVGGLSDGAIVTEEMIDQPDRVGHYSRAKLLIERMLASEQQAGHFEVVVVRPGLVFGPGTSPLLEHLPHLGSLIGDRYLLFGDGNVRLPLNYVGNLVDALWQCATMPAAAGQTLTIVDDELPTQREFIARAAALTGRPLRVIAVPRAGAYLVGLGVEALFAALKKKPPTTRGLLLGKTVKLSFDTTRAKQVLQWTPQVGWQDGLTRAVEASKAVGRPAPAAA